MNLTTPYDGLQYIQFIHHSFDGPTLAASHIYALCAPASTQPLNLGLRSRTPVPPQGQASPGLQGRIASHRNKFKYTLKVNARENFVSNLKF